MRFLVFALAAVVQGADSAHLLRNPAISKSHIVFEFAEDLWIAPRAGGDASRLTSGPGAESDAHFSPDGSMVAFTGNYDGSMDVFTVPVTGGVPKRLTYHPGPDVAMGWSPDGKRVLFVNQGTTHNAAGRLYTVGVEGGFPEALPLPTGSQGAFSPDGKRIAYLPWGRADRAWKRYRGGRATPIWIADLADSSVVKVPRTDSNEHSPMWVGDKLYFLSDRGGRYSIYSYDPGSKKVSAALDNKGMDIKSASAASDAIAFERFGEIHILDPKTGKERQLDLRLSGADVTAVRPRLEKLGRSITSFNISPSGARAVFEARGEILTVPGEKGDVRNLTQTSGVAERDPAWSPDARWIAYFSDESGEYELHVRNAAPGSTEVKKIALDEKPTFYYNPVWSPDSKKIAYVDKRTNLWYVDVETKKPVRVDNGTYHESYFTLDPQWSPDSKWISYNKQLKTRLHQVMLYSLAEAKSYPATDGMSDAREAVWDKGGKYLYFAASTDSGPSLGGLDMSSSSRPITRNLYLVVLSKADPSPFAPESDEEKIAPEKKESDAPKPDAAKPGATKTVEVKIDTEGLTQRTVPLPMPARNYSQLQTGKSGLLFVVESPVLLTAATFSPASRVLHKFDLSKRKSEQFLTGVGGYALAANGDKILFRQGERWAIQGTGAPPKPGEGTIKTADMEAFVDPRAEWRQMYKEVWRLERDFFYDPNLHGVNYADFKTKYEKYIDRLGSRGDLNYLFQEMLGELSVGHLYVGGGDDPDQPKRVRGGLLGADYTIENGRYKIAKIFSGESWNPQTRAPLTQPGVNVNVGDYVIAVNGRNVTAAENIYSFFEGTAGKSVTLRVSANANGEGGRDSTVIPLDSEVQLRTLNWMEENRRKVDQMSGGKLAYIHLPDTGAGGYEYFNRYYFAQTDKQGAIIDERWNRGGKAADYIIDYLRRPLWNYWTSRDGADYSTPATAIFGPKVMIANEYSGSGGDLLPWLFKRAKLGPVVGTRTWGGLVGIGGYPTLIDGGSVTAPHFGFWNPDGKWDVENHGTEPDVVVEMDPKEWRKGRDPQLERAVEIAMEELKKNPPPAHKKPAFPNYHRPPAPASSAGQGQ